MCVELRPSQGPMSTLRMICE